MINPHELTIVLPVWNEEQVIESTLTELMQVTGLNPCPVLVMDDGSTDGTAAVLQTFCGNHPRVRFVTLPHGGKDRALWAATTEVKTPWMGMMDADGQYDPQDFLRMMEEIGNGGAVWGIRHTRHDLAWRLLISRAAKAIKRKMLGGNAAVQDTGCGIWLARTDGLRCLPAVCPEPAGQVHCHIPEIISAQGLEVKQINITHRFRAGGTAKYGMLNRLLPGWISLQQARKAIKNVKSECR